MGVGLIIAAVTIGATVATTLFAKGPRSTKGADMAPANLDAFRLTTAEEGTVIPRVFGTVRLPGNLLYYGNLSSEPEYEETTVGGKGGKKKKQKKQKNLTAWDRVQIARSSDRPSAAEYIDAIFDDFMEFHGDRGVRDDNAIIGGIATLDGQPVTVIGIRKGHTTKENIRCNFGMPSPEGYKKALRLMKQAEKFGRAVIAFVDTPGAFCGLEAEERGQGEAIARNLLEMSDLKVPVLSVVIGEGGSGGALALAVGNEVWMMENATYTILSPEGFASILWKDSRKAPEAAEVMKVTAAHLKELGIIERIIPEEYPASEENLPEIAEYMKIRMKQFLEKQTGKSGLQIAQERYERFRKM